MNNKAFYDNWKIVRTQFALEPKRLGLKTFNKRVCWETDQKTLKTWKVGPKELSTEELIDQKSTKFWITMPECREVK